MKTYLLLACGIAGSSLFFSYTGKESTKAGFHKHTLRRTLHLPEGDVRIVIDKSDYELSVYDEKGWYASYPVVFGNKTLSDKKMEGDRNTPEGSFKIISKRIHDKWDRYMGLDYPTQESWDKFKKRKAKGEIPSSAKIGGGIGIHGTWPNEDYQIDRYYNWTLGCISMKNSDVEELYDYVPVGTSITIQK